MSMIRGGLGFVLLIAGAALCGAGAFAAPAAEVGINWRVVNGFRLIKGADEEKRYREDMKRITSNETHAREKYPDPISERRPYPTYWQEGEDAYEAGYLAPGGERLVKLDARLPARMKPGASCVWRLDGGAEIADATCQGVPDARLVEGQSHAVALTVTFGGQAYQAETTIRLKDLVIVVLGDSYGAGEGVPLANATTVSDGERSLNEDALWQDRRCHRSLFSGFNQAVLALSEGLRDRHVTLLDFSCSGATMKTRPDDDRKGGLLARYEGKAPPRKGEMLEPQVAAAGRALCAPGQFEFDDRNYSGTCKQSALPADADVLTLVSVGGNDIGFAKVIAKFAKRKYDFAECERKFGKDFRYTAQGMERLPRDYADLDKAIRSSFAPKRISIVEYPDPTRDDKGDFTEAGPICRAKWLNKLIGHHLVIEKEEHHCAYEKVLTSLNAIIARAAETHGWTYVGGMMTATRNKGICAKGTNFTWIAAAEARTNSFSGAYHPNVFGYLRYQEALLPALRRQVAGLATRR